MTDSSQASEFTVMTSPDLIVEQEQDITIITINRPALKNAIDGSTAVLLADAFRSFDLEFWNCTKTAQSVSNRFGR